MSRTNVGSPLPLAGQQLQDLKPLGEEEMAWLVPTAQDVTCSLLNDLLDFGGGRAEDCWSKLNSKYIAYLN